MSMASQKEVGKRNQQTLLKMWKNSEVTEDLLILSDYNKGSINAQDWIKVGLKKNIPIFMILELKKLKNR